VLRTQSDERLVDLVRAGSEPAFEAIVTRYRRAILRYCASIVSEERAEDAAQQTFVRAYDAMRASDAKLRLRPWLYRIAHNTALNSLRDRGLRHEQLEDSFDGVERPDQALERKLGLREVLVAVQKLPERQRDAILLRELEGRSYDQIAAELGVTGGAVRQLLHRARSTVRAAATALTPAGFLTRLPLEGPGEPVAARVAELTGVAGTGAVVAKVTATALVTGAVVGGVAAVPERGTDDAASAKPKPGQKVPSGPGAGAGATTEGGSRLSAGETGGRSGGDGRRGGDDGGSGGGEDHDRSGRGHGGSGDSGSGSGGDSGPGGGGHSGPGGGGGSSGTDSGGPGDSIDSSGPGSGETIDPLDSSGPGSGGSGSSGSSGSGSGLSGSGSGSSGSGSD
jgi:RNA polymerase sigma factor (sigma-70 family)